jgi:hypothetical protein
MLDVPCGPNGAPIAIVNLSGTTQQVVVAGSAGASAQSAAFAAGTEAIMISLRSTDQDVRMKLGGANPVASATTDLLPKPGVYFFKVKGGDKVAFIGDNATGFTLTFSEIKSMG